MSDIELGARRCAQVLDEGTTVEMADVIETYVQAERRTTCAMLRERGMHDAAKAIEETNR